jgi:4-amino-4-deoxy-L-arabinose transferase-like glycosyltransferase
MVRDRISFWWKKHWQLWLVLILASLLRVVNLDSAPVSLYWEEVALGYDAYSVLKTGRDHHGALLPVVAFESFGDWKPSGYFYALVPFVATVGLNAWAVRLPSALAGIAMVYLVYLIALELGVKKKAATLAALMLVVMPWHIHFSRAGFEVNLATTLLGTGMWFLLKARRQSAYFLLAALAMVASMYTYHGLRLLAPMMTVFAGVLFWSTYIPKFRWIVGSVVISIILLLPLITAFNSPVVQDRFNETSWFAVSEAVAKTNLWRAEDGNTLLSRVIHHRYWYWTKEISSNALAHLNLDFLFISGDGNQRHQTGYFALLYPWMIVPLLWGIYSSMKKPDRSFALLVGWMLLATIPPALTQTTPHSLRYLPAAPAFALLMGIGLSYGLQWLKRRRWSIFYRLGVGGLVILSLAIYLYDYHGAYRKRAAGDWQDGYEELMLYLKPYWDEGKTMTITRSLGRPVMYALFYWQVDPGLAQRQAGQVAMDQGELLQLEGVTFGDTAWSNQRCSGEHGVNH